MSTGSLEAVGHLRKSVATRDRPDRTEGEWKEVAYKGNYVETQGYDWEVRKLR